MRRLSRTMIAFGVVATALVGMVASPHADPPPDAGYGPAATPAGKVVATVNGQPILESELMAALPEDAFQDQLNQLKADKLERLVDGTVRRQFLAEHKVVVDEKDVAREIESFQKMITTPGCPCCGGGYESLEQFLKVNCFSAAEFRQMIGNAVGLRLYAQRVAREKLPPAVLAAQLERCRQQVLKDYVKGSVILFDCTQDPRFMKDPRAVSAEKKKLADRAWQRLKDNEAFATVAREMSDHRYSAVEGGAMGCIPGNMLGTRTQQVWQKLAPGAFSEPIGTAWGFCIVQREEFTDEDIARLVDEELASSVLNDVFREYDTAKAKAKIQY